MEKKKEKTQTLTIEIRVNEDNLHILTEDELREAYFNAKGKKTTMSKEELISYFYVDMALEWYHCVQLYSNNLTESRLNELIKLAKFVDENYVDESTKCYYISECFDLPSSTAKIIKGFKIFHPLVKGIYLKVSDKEERLSDIKSWMKQPTIQSIDRLEKNGLRNAMLYENFINKWVDWKQIANRIPYRFGDPDVFLSKNKFFEIENGGAVYMLSVVKYLPTGTELSEADFSDEKLIESQDDDLPW